MAAYYNEIDPNAATWLRKLIATNVIAPGDVDERSIVDVQSDDLRGYKQCHFFAGIGGWSIALRMALWSDDRPVWTGSCPCQPFSQAGSQNGHADERHLWPHWARLIRECRPATVFGEQVAGAIAFGWVDEVFNDLENEKYACATAVLPACSVGKPHKRDRLWFMAKSDDKGQSSCSIDGEVGGKLCSGGEALANTNCERPQRLRPNDNQERWEEPDLGSTGLRDGAGLHWIDCPDGKARPVKPGIRLLAHGVQHRAPILHAFGNAIVPQVAAEFIKAAM